MPSRCPRRPRTCSGPCSSRASSPSTTDPAPAVGDDVPTSDFSRESLPMPAPPVPGRCHGPSRRALLQAGLFGLCGAGLGDLLRLRALASPARSIHTGPARNCILIWLAGGASHIDTFDPKPEAPADVRGEFRPIDTAVPGLRISE